jgi:hypothetical protein
MSSGVEFREEEDSGRDLKRLWSDMVSGSWIFPKGTIKSITQFNRRIAHDGAWEGTQIIPSQWMIDATTTRPSDAYLAPGRASRTSMGYGYLLWLLPGARRQFATIRILGQYVLHRDQTEDFAREGRKTNFIETVG